MKPNAWIACGAILAGLAVAMGAFGAHGLKPWLTERAGLSAEAAARSLETYETAARYHMYHALALILIGMFAQRDPSRSLDAAGWSFLVGILLFSGLCYAIALGGPKKLGAIVPIGGVAFIIGWLAMAIGALKQG